MDRSKDFAQLEQHLYGWLTPVTESRVKKAWHTAWRDHHDTKAGRAFKRKEKADKALQRHGRKGDYHSDKAAEHD